MLKWLPFILVCIGVSGCDNTFDITAPWKDVPVVYGVISPADTAHYIRIEKAFLDANQSALELARIPDSLYYDNLDASIIHVNSGSVFQLAEVNGSVDGYVREDGVFAEDPNILYKLNSSDILLTIGDVYRLSINRGDELDLVEAETVIVGAPTVKVPGPSTPLRFRYENDFKILWVLVDDAGFYDVSIITHFRERDNRISADYLDKSNRWKIARNLSTDEWEFPGRDYFENLDANLESNSQIQRIFDGIDIEVEAGGPELLEFLRVTQANTGITSVGGDIPRYTNLSEGIGLFSSSNLAARRDYDLHPVSMDSLRNGIITGGLNFQ